MSIFTVTNTSGHPVLPFLKFPSEQDREARVEELLRVLGLESCADVRIGNPLERGISGGQAKRLSVGLGVADLESVRLLLLDEPTTVRSRQYRDNFLTIVPI